MDMQFITRLKNVLDTFDEAIDYEEVQSGCLTEEQHNRLVMIRNEFSQFIVDITPRRQIDIPKSMEQPISLLSIYNLYDGDDWLSLGKQHKSKYEIEY